MVSCIRSSTSISSVEGTSEVAHILLHTYKVLSELSHVIMPLNVNIILIISIAKVYQKERAKKIFLFI